MLFFYVHCISLYLTCNLPTTDTPSQGWHGGAHCNEGFHCKPCTV